MKTTSMESVAGQITLRILNTAAFARGILLKKGGGEGTKSSAGAEWRSGTSLSLSFFRQKEESGEFSGQFEFA